MANSLLQLERRAQQADISNAPTILAIVGVFTGFALLIVALRGYVRAKMLRAVGTDDYVIFAAMVRQHTCTRFFLGATLTSLPALFGWDLRRLHRRMPQWCGTTYAISHAREPHEHLSLGVFPLAPCDDRYQLGQDLNRLLLVPTRQ